MSDDSLVIGQTPDGTRQAGEPTPVMDDRQQLQARLERRDLQLAAMRTIGQALAAQLDLHEIYRVMYREIAQGLLGAHDLMVALFDRATETLSCGFAVVDGKEIDARLLPHLPLEDDPISETIRTRQPRIVDLPAQRPQLPVDGQATSAGADRDPLSALYVPMINGDRVIGAIHVQHDEANAFRETDVPLVTMLAGQAAAAVENAQLFTAEREHRALSEALRDTAAAVNSTLNFDEVLDRILTNAGRVVPHDFADIMLVQGGIARIARFHGTDEYLAGDLLTMHFPVSDFPNLRQMISEGKPLIIADTFEYAGWVNIANTRVVRSYAGAPIRLKGLIVGFINLHSRHPNLFSATQAGHLQALADQAAIAFENATLYGSIQRHADELERRVAERTRELASANARLQELDHLKDQFISNVSHELRTPLANTKLFLGLLEHGRPEKREQYLQTLHRETARLGSLIEDLLELSRLDMGAARIHLEPTDLNVLAAELIGDRTALAADRGLALDCRLDPDLSHAWGDPKRIAQVMTNLVANSINYTPSGGLVNLMTGLQDDDGGQWVTFTVQDNGNGISAEEMPHLFERFYRGEASRVSGAPGTGLGLAICKEIVEKMGGRITVESEPGQGAAFTVWLKPAYGAPPG